MAAWQQIKDLEVFGDALDSVPPPFEANEQATPPSFGASESKEQVQPKEPKRSTLKVNELKAPTDLLSERAKRKLPIVFMTLVLAFPYYSAALAQVALDASNLPREMAIYDLLGGYTGVVAVVVAYWYCLPYAPAYFFTKTEETRHRVHWILAVFWCLFNLLISQKYVFVETWPQ